MEDLSGIVSRALAAFSAAGDAASLENAKARFLGKSGELTALQSTLKSLSNEEKRAAGAKFNAAQQRSELAHVGRISMMGELAATLVHELNQPLTAILSNAKAGLRFMAREPVDLKELHDSLVQTAQSLGSSNEKRNLFVATLVHELRNFLSAAYTGVDVLRSKAPASLYSLVDALSRPILVQGRQVFLGVSIGVTLFPEDAAGGTALLKNADIAMYQAKVAGKGCFRFYSRAMDQAVERRVRMEQDLRGAGGGW